MKTHSQDAFKCTKCSESFLRKDRLDKHMQKDHSEICVSSNIKVEEGSLDFQHGINDLGNTEDILQKEPQAMAEAAMDLSLKESTKISQDNQAEENNEVLCGMMQDNDACNDKKEDDGGGYQEYETEEQDNNDVQGDDTTIDAYNDMQGFIKEEECDNMEDLIVKEDEYEDDDDMEDDDMGDSDDNAQEDDEEEEETIIKYEEEEEDEDIGIEYSVADAASETEEQAEEQDPVEDSSTTSESEDGNLPESKDERPTTPRRSSRDMVAHEIVNHPNASYDNFDVPTEVLVEYEDVAQEPCSDVEQDHDEHDHDDDCLACRNDEDEDDCSHDEIDEDCSQCIACQNEARQNEAHQIEARQNEACQNEMNPLVESKVIQYITSIAKGCLKMDDKLRHELQLSSTEGDGEESVDDENVESCSTVTETSKVDEEVPVNCGIASKSTGGIDAEAGDEEEEVEEEIDDERDFQNCEEDGEKFEETNEDEENEVCEETTGDGGDTNEDCGEQNDGNEETNGSDGNENGEDINDQNEDNNSENGEQDDGGDENKSNDEDNNEDDEDDDDDEAYDGANEETTEEEEDDCEDEDEDKFHEINMNGVDSNQNCVEEFKDAGQNPPDQIAVDNDFGINTDLSNSDDVVKNCNDKQFVTTGMTTDEIPGCQYLDLDVVNKCREESKLGQTEVLQSLMELCENYEELSSGDEDMSSETNRKSQETISEIIKKETEFLENFDSDSRVDSTDSEVVIVKKPRNSAVNGFDNQTSTVSENSSESVDTEPLENNRPKKAGTSHNGIIKRGRPKNLLKVSHSKGAKKFIAKKGRGKKINMKVCRYCQKSFEGRNMKSHRAICPEKPSNVNRKNCKLDGSDSVLNSTRKLGPPVSSEITRKVGRPVSSEIKRKLGRPVSSEVLKRRTSKTCQFCHIHVQKSLRLKTHEIRCSALKKQFEYLEQHPEVVKQAFADGKAYRCPFCIKDCKARQRFEQHWRLCQQRKRRIEQVKMGLEVAAEYSCSYCVRSFSEESTWAKHEDECRKLEKQYEEIMQSPPPRPVYECKRCSKNFNKKYVWERHRRKCTGPKKSRGRPGKSVQLNSMARPSTQPSALSRPPDFSQSNSRSLKRLTMDLEFEFVSPNLNSSLPSLRSIPSNNSSPAKSTTSHASVSPARSTSSKNGDKTLRKKKRRSLDFSKESPDHKRKKESPKSSPSKKTSPKRSSLQLKSLQLKKKSLQQQATSMQLKRHSFRCRYCNEFCYNIEKLIVHERRCLFVKEYSELPSQLREHFGIAFF